MTVEWLRLSTLLPEEADLDDPYLGQNHHLGELCDTIIAE